MTTEHSTKVGTTTITIKADFAQASDQILARYADCGERGAEFDGTGKQVADFRHDPKAALKYFAEQFARA